MKQGLQVRLHQQLALTPQLQQAIRLLQMSTLELGTELRQLTEANPLLDLEDLAEDPGVADSEPPIDAAPDGDIGDGDDEHDHDELPTTGDEPLALDASLSSTTGNGKAGDPWQPVDSSGSESLCDHLLWQLDVTSMPPRQRAIITVLIHALDDDGYLRVGNDEIRGALDDAGIVSDNEIEAARQLLMQFDPTGCGSRTLSECLCAQLDPADPECSDARLAYRIVSEDLGLLAHNDRTQLARRLGVDIAALGPAIDFIHSLIPKPGDRFDSTPVEYVVPDAYAVKHQGVWQVSLNPEAQPRLEINQHYRDLIGKTSREDTSYLRAQLQEARWLLKSLESRAETIYKVALAIVEAQSAFLDFGPEAMRPLVLRDVAEAIDMHESTISRVTTRKYLHTPRGIFEFKYFFSSAVGTEDGGSASATAIRALIRKLVDSEDRGKPYSDQALVSALGQQGIQVARRTVAKYRKELRIPNSSQRVRRHA